MLLDQNERMAARALDDKVWHELNEFDEKVYLFTQTLPQLSEHVERKVADYRARVIWEVKAASSNLSAPHVALETNKVELHIARVLAEVLAQNENMAVETVEEATRRALTAFDVRMTIVAQSFPILPHKVQMLVSEHGDRIIQEVQGAACVNVTVSHLASVEHGVAMHVDQALNMLMDQNERMAAEALNGATRRALDAFDEKVHLLE